MPPRPEDRRRKERVSLEFRSIQVTARMDGRPFEILNIGPSGLLGQGSGLAREGSRVAIELPGLEPISGLVVWDKAELAGVSFDLPISDTDFARFLEKAGANG